MRTISQGPSRHTDQCRRQLTWGGTSSQRSCAVWSLLLAARFLHRVSSRTLWCSSSNRHTFLADQRSALVCTVLSRSFLRSPRSFWLYLDEPYTHPIRTSVFFLWRDDVYSGIAWQTAPNLLQTDCKSFSFSGSHTSTVLPCANLSVRAFTCNSLSAHCVQGLKQCISSFWLYFLYSSCRVTEDVCAYPMGDKEAYEAVRSVALWRGHKDDSCVRTPYRVVCMCFSNVAWIFTCECMTYC